MAICSSSSINKEPKRLSLSLGKCRKIVVVDEEEIENAKKPVVPKNTRKATDWAVGVFKQWIEQHNAIAENKCPVDILKDEPENLGINGKERTSAATATRSHRNGTDYVGGSRDILCYL